MKTLALLFALLLTGPLFAQRGPADLDIDGAEIGTVGQAVVLTLHGLELDGDDPKISEILALTKRVAIDVDCPPGAKAEIEPDLKINWLTGELALQLKVSAVVAGDYVIFADWNEPPFGLARHRISFAPDKPLPPDPDDDDVVVVPPEPGTRWLLIIHEAKETTFAQEQLFTQLRTATEIRGKHKLKIVDDDATDENGQSVDGLDPWIKRASGKSLPYLFILDNAGKILSEGACPATKAAVIELLNSKGG
jgi:hypothetical protein